MANPKVSVIIPVYNTEMYIEQTISSIQTQTLKDIEIVVIDDGSTDLSGLILTNLSQEDTRIRVFSQVNQGLSITRNVGLNNSLGDYIYFMDSDDLLDDDTLEICYNQCEKNSLDMVFFDADIIIDENYTKKWWYDYNRAAKIDQQVYKGLDLMELLLDKDIFRASACLFFVRKDYLLVNNFKFYPGIIHEDELYTPLLFMKAERVEYIPRMFFHRRVRENSIMTSGFSQRNVNGYLTVIDQLRESYSNEKRRERSVVRKIEKKIAISIGHQAVSLPLFVRLKVLYSLLIRGLIGFISINNLIGLLSPFTQKFKENKIKPLLKNIFKSKSNRS